MALRPETLLSSQEIIPDRPAPFSIRPRQLFQRCNVRPHCESCALSTAAFYEVNLESACDQSPQQYFHCKNKTARACDTGGKYQTFPATSVRGFGFVPKFLGGLITVGSGFVQRLLFLAERGVNCHHSLPRPISQPLFFHLPLAGLLRRRFALIFCNVETPSLLR